MGVDNVRQTKRVIKTFTGGSVKDKRLKNKVKEVKYTYTLKEFLARHGYAGVGRLIGVTTAGVRQMDMDGRHTYFKKIKGEWCYFEVKDWRRSGKTVQAA